MIRILQCVNNMHRAGLETVLMNYYRHIDRDKIQFDFLMHRAERSDYDDEIESLGGRIYRAPRLYPQNYPAYFIYMSRFFREHPEYRIVHSHIDAMSYLPLLAAKRAGVPVRIAHSHSAGIDRDFKYPLKLVFRSLLPSVCNYRVACGRKAGDFLFGAGEYAVVPNAINAETFVYSEALRVEKRRELGVEDAFVIGHVGRFSAVKNHEFLLKTFASISDILPEARLILAGSGETEQKTKTQADKLGLISRIHFLGSRDDVQELYQAMDVFVMPSFFEGVPGGAIEAQFAGLPCLLSDRISEEVAFTDSCRFLPLERGADAWAQEIIAVAGANRDRKAVECPCYDIRKAACSLEEYYSQLGMEL